jgi:hypothetical protein
MLRNLCKIRVRTRASKDLNVPCRDRTSALPLERPTHDRVPAALATRAHDLVYEFNKLLRKVYSDLLAHQGQGGAGPQSASGSLGPT